MIIKHYVLDDRQCRRSILVFIGVLGLTTLVPALLVVFGKLPALFLLVISAGFSFAASFVMPIVVAIVIQREKAEGSFRLLRALPLPSETLFGGTVLAGAIASVVSFLPLYTIVMLASIPQGARLVLPLICTGWIALLMSLLSASFVLTVALNVNSPTALSYLMAGFLAVVMFSGMLPSLFEQKLRPLLEDRLKELLYFILSLEGIVFVSAITIVVSVLIFYVGSRLFLRKRSYV